MTDRTMPCLSASLLLIGMFSLLGKAVEAQVVVNRAGIRIIEYPAGPHATPRFSIPSPPDIVFLDFGPQAGQDQSWVFRVGTSTTIVAGAGMEGIRAYGDDGSLQWVVEQAELEGGGLQAVQWVGRLAGDTIGVWDNTTSSLALLTADGILHATERIPAVDLDFGATGGVLVRRGPIVMGSLSDGSLIAAVPRVELDPLIGVHRTANPLVRFDRRTASWKTLGASIGAEWVRVSGTGRHASFRLPSGAIGAVAAAGRLIAIGWSDEPEIRLLDAEGDVHVVLNANLERLRLTEQDRERQAEQILARANARDRALIERALQELLLPDRWPAHGRILLVENELWIQEGAATESSYRRWFVYSLDGTFQGMIDLPIAFEPTYAGQNYLLGILTDAGGQYSAVQYRLDRQ